MCHKIGSDTFDLCYLCSILVGRSTLVTIFVTHRHVFFFKPLSGLLKLLCPRDQVVALYGNKGGGGLRGAQIIAVCTIEKANALVNRMAAADVSRVDYRYAVGVTI